MQKRNPRWLLISGLAIPIVAAFVGGAFAVSDQFSPAKPGQPTYQVESVYIGSASSLTPAFKEMGFTAVLELTYSWSDGVYPGPAECRVEYFDMDGSPVGMETLQLDSYAESGTTSVPGRVADSAASGVAECSAGILPAPDSRILVSDVSIAEYAPDAAFNPDPEVGARLSGTAHWASEENPGAQQCMLTAISSGGTDLSFSFTAEVADGRDFGIQVPTSFLGSSEAGVECHRYDGAAQ